MLLGSPRLVHSKWELLAEFHQHLALTDCETHISFWATQTEKSCHLDPDISQDTQTGRRTTVSEAPGKHILESMEVRIFKAVFSAQSADGKTEARKARELPEGPLALTVVLEAEDYS